MRRMGRVRRNHSVEYGLAAYSALRELAGAESILVVKYQMLIMFQIAGGMGMGSVAAVLGGVYRLTDSRHRLRLDRLAGPK